MTRHRPQPEAPWRSLEARAEPEAPDRREHRFREFAPGVDEPPSGPTRRTVLGLMGASVALAGLTSCRRPVEEIVPYVNAPELLVPGIPQQYATTLTRGTDVLGVLVKAREGRPIKIEGNDLHPTSRGAADAWAQAAILGLYDPDRSRQVWHREGGGEGGGQTAAGGRAGGRAGEASQDPEDAAADPAAKADVVEDALEEQDETADESHAEMKGGTGEASTWDEFNAFWGERAAALAGSDGSGLGVLIEPYASPSVHRLVRELRRRYANAKVAVWGPVDDDNVFEGVRRATGRPGRPVLHLEKAQVVLTLDADVLLTETGGVANTRGFAAHRRGEGEMSRLYAVESTLSLTGANADHRVRLASRHIPAFTAALAAALGAGSTGSPSQTLPDGMAQKVQSIARDLRSAGSNALIVAGRNQPPAVHEQVWRLNRTLGALGNTVTRGELGHTGASSIADLTALVEAMRGGEIETLVILGGNPAYDAPTDLGFARAMRSVAETVHLSFYRDETSRRASWHLPRSHDLEAWGDAAAPDGTLSVVQPLVAPLFDTRSLIEVLALLAPAETPAVAQGAAQDAAPSGDAQEGDAQEGDAQGGAQEVAQEGAGEEAATGEGDAEGSADAGAEGEPPAPPTGYETVRSTWADLLGGADVEKRWRRVLHDGLAAPDVLTGGGTAAAAATADLGPAADRASSRTNDGTADGTDASSGDGFEVTFQVSRAVGDGRFANLAWLQEMPDPITKITWDNAALVSPATARELELTDGDVIELTAGERSIEVSVFRLPGQADRSIALALGYGRTAAGRVGNGIGTDVYPLRTSASPWVLGGASVKKTGRRHALVQTQEHGDMEGRDLIRRASFEEYRHGASGHGASDQGSSDPGEHGESHGAFAAAHHGPPLESLWEEPSYESGYKWGMSIDLSTCTGCNACVVACQSENNVPVVGREQVAGHREMHWLRVDRYFLGDDEEPHVAFQPVPCQHCENAPCEQVCPVAATVHDAEGLNLMVYNRCIGTRYCSNNCPYKVRRFNFFNYTRETPGLMELAMNPDVTIRTRGVMEKCTYCLQRISAAKAEAKRDGRRKIRDGEIRTACQQTCPADAIAFGDLNTPDSEVAQAKHSDRSYEILAELNNKPRTSYKGRLHHPNPDWPDAENAKNAKQEGAA